MVTVNAIGDACPLPVVKTKEAIKALNGDSEVEVFVDNEIAVENIEKMAKQKGYEYSSEKTEDNNYRVILKTEKDKQQVDDTGCKPYKKNIVAVINSKYMGEGDEKLGETLLKGFIFALTQLEELPTTMLFYNGGASITCEGSASLEDLQKLEESGVKIMTCGTCLNFYGLTEKLAVGEVTNMYTIAEIMANADLIIRP